MFGMAGPLKIIDEQIMYRTYCIIAFILTSSRKQIPSVIMSLNFVITDVTLRCKW